MSLTKEVALHFRDAFRAGREAALRDSEAFEEIVFVVERLGRYLTLGRVVGLGSAGPAIRQLTADGPLAVAMSKSKSRIHTPFDATYDLMRNGRNSAFHEGAYARHLTVKSVELALILEDALMATMSHVGDFMVQGIVIARPWQPISYVRQIMLTNGFSFLPGWFSVDGSQGWKLISDHAVASYLREAASSAERASRLAETLENAVAVGALRLDQPLVCTPDTPVASVLAESRGLPVLIHGGDERELIGIATAHDLL
jgi:hypothetical protein